jgi:hypothetical protein
MASMEFDRQKLKRNPEFKGMSYHQIGAAAQSWAEESDELGHRLREILTRPKDQRPSAATFRSLAARHVHARNEAVKGILEMLVLCARKEGGAPGSKED